MPLVQRYNSILVVVDQLTKMVYFIPTIEKTSAEGLARLFRDNMWKLHGLPESIISDRGPQFMAGLMRELNRMLGIKSKLSMAFHPQTDGQTVVRTSSRKRFPMHLNTQTKTSKHTTE